MVQFTVCDVGDGLSTFVGDSPDDLNITPVGFRVGTDSNELINQWDMSAATLADSEITLGESRARSSETRNFPGEIFDVAQHLDVRGFWPPSMQHLVRSWDWRRRQ